MLLEKAHPRYLRPGRPISVSDVPFGPGIDIWRSCQFVGALMRSLCTLPGGSGRLFLVLLVLITVGSGILVGNGVATGLPRPRESASGAFLKELLQLFRSPPRSALALLAGTLPLRYCAVRFASRVPTWRLPVPGHVAGLVTVADVAEVGEGVSWVSGSGPGRKRIRLNRKTSAHLAGISGTHSRPRVWKRLRHVGHFVGALAGDKRRRLDQQDENCVPGHHRTGVG